MPLIMPIKDLRNTTEISNIAHKEQEPIFITKNGYSIPSASHLTSILAPKMLYRSTHIRINKMNKSEAISIISKCADTYKNFLDGKQVVFVYRNESNHPNYTEAKFRS